MIILYCLALLVLGFILAKCADFVVKAISYFSHSLAVKSFLLGFFILGFATNIPEILVVYQSLHDGIPQLAVGDLLGGSILLLSFVMGFGAIILRRIVLDHGMTIRDIAFSSAIVAAPAVVLWDGKLTRIEGGVLLIVYLVHILLINRQQHVIDHVERHAKSVLHAWHAIKLFIIGLVGMIVSAKLLVFIAELLAAQFDISPLIIGLFILTIGTNLPELTLMLEAIVKKKKDIAFGDILGSSTIHTPLLGIICLVHPFTITDTARMQATLLLLALVSVFFFWAASTKRDITRREGIVLLTVFIAFVLFEMLHI